MLLVRALETVGLRESSYFAQQVIVTSYLFPDARLSLERLRRISSIVGKDRLVVDVRCVVFCSPLSFVNSALLSCRRRADKWFVAMDKWQRITETEVCKGRHLNPRNTPCLSFLTRIVQSRSTSSQHIAANF